MKSSLVGKFPRSKEVCPGEFFHEYREVTKGVHRDTRVAHALTGPSGEVAELVPRVEGPNWLATMPDAETDMLSFPGYVRDEELGWVLGHHPLFNGVQNKNLHDLLTR